MKKERVYPTNNDILCGRGVACFQHEGNQQFRTTVALHLPKYTHSKTSRHQKTILIQNIVENQFQDGVRFLKECDGGWVALTRNESLTKVGQSLRDAAAKMKRCLDAGKQNTKGYHDWDTACKFLETICQEDKISEGSDTELIKNPSAIVSYSVPNTIVAPIMAVECTSSM